MSKGLRIFYDVDTQHDFMDKDGALYVPGAEEIKPNLNRLMQYAIEKEIALVGSVDKHFGTEKYRHREIELKRWGGKFPDHCMAGTKGQEKISETSRFYYPQGEEVALEIYIPHNLDKGKDESELRYALRAFKHSKEYGLFFEKQHNDIFTNPIFERFLRKADIKKAVVYGVATDYCVKAAVLGMQQRGVQCYVVEDAIAAVSSDTGEKSLEEMVKSGAKLITTKGVLENKMEW